MFIVIILGKLLLLTVQEHLVLIVGSENIVFCGLQTVLVQPESLPQKPCFLGLSVATRQTVGLMMLSVIFWTAFGISLK